MVSSTDLHPCRARPVKQHHEKTVMRIVRRAVAVTLPRATDRAPQSRQYA